jgi:acyl-CoA thioesterase II
VRQDRPVSDNEPIFDLLALLALEKLGDDRFRGQSNPDTLTRVFGGQVAAQALIAASATVAPDRPVHSLHSYFLRPGDPSTPIDYEVERLRDGRGFSARRVSARQHGKVTFTLAASFHVPERAVLTHAATAPPVPRPETLPTLKELIAPHLDKLPKFLRKRELPVDIRPVQGYGDQFRLWSGKPAEKVDKDIIWFRSNGALPEDPAVHVCVATYVSDLMALDAVLLWHNDYSDTSTANRVLGRTDIAMASLDHAMWFHEPIRADEWVLYETTSPAAGLGRGFAVGRMYSADGRLLVSLAQEGLFRSQES